jgi:transcriptional regulator with XRE-family HTH domain
MLAETRGCITVCLTKQAGIYVSTLGERIRNAREDRGLSQTQLAEECGWDGKAGQTRISHYEHNKREPTLSDLSLIASKLGVNVQALVFEHPLRPDPDEELLLRARRAADPRQRRVLNSWVEAVIPPPQKSHVSKKTLMKKR